MNFLISDFLISFSRIFLIVQCRVSAQPSSIRLSLQLAFEQPTQRTGSFVFVPFYYFAIPTHLRHQVSSRIYPSGLKPLIVCVGGAIFNLSLPKLVTRTIDIFNQSSLQRLLLSTDFHITSCCIILTVLFSIHYVPDVQLHLATFIEAFYDGDYDDDQWRNNGVGRVGKAQGSGPPSSMQKN